jgi:hypothetical protein
MNRAEIAGPLRRQEMKINHFESVTYNHANKTVTQVLLSLLIDMHQYLDSAPIVNPFHTKRSMNQAPHPTHRARPMRSRFTLPNGKLHNDRAVFRHAQSSPPNLGPAEENSPAKPPTDTARAAVK